jgi:hypothetical protein
VTSFEYVIVLVSIIVALAIAHLLTAIRSVQKPIWLVVVLNQNRNSPMNVRAGLRGVTQ